MVIRTHLNWTTSYARYHHIPRKNAWQAQAWSHSTSTVNPPNAKLKTFADETKGLDQYAIRKFAEALDVVPRTLAENSGCDPTRMMHTLHTAHTVDGAGATMGFDIEECVARDSVAAEIFDLFATKINAMRLAVDAAVTILKVDQIVMSKPAGGPKPGGPGGM